MSCGVLPHPGHGGDHTAFFFFPCCSWFRVRLFFFAGLFALPNEWWWGVGEEHFSDSVDGDSCVREPRLEAKAVEDGGSVNHSKRGERVAGDRGSWLPKQMKRVERRGQLREVGNWHRGKCV